MVENASLCLICTSKVNICCNLRIDYEDKYNSKCLQKILSYSNCLLCDSNSTSRAKTQDMPSNMLQQIELFMNSTSFPESYSNSVLCLTCIHFLNIWHKVRSSVMKLKQSDENYGAFNSTDEPKKTKTTKNCTIDKSNEENLTVIDLVDSDTEVTLSSFKQDGNIPGDEDNKVSFSDCSRSESLSLINNLQLLPYKHVLDHESLISESCNSEIDFLSKIVDEIVESYESSEDSLQSNSLNLDSTVGKNFDDELSLTTIDYSFDNENEFITTSHHLLPITLNFSMSSSVSENSSLYYSACSSDFLISKSNWITAKTNFSNAMKDSSGREPDKEASQDSKISNNRDSLWFYLNKKLDKLQSVQKLIVNKMEKINLPKNGLDDKFYKQLPYVLLNNDEVPKAKMVTENFPKMNSITTALLDEESLGDFKTWCCGICDRTSKTLCEHKVHELLHVKPEQVVINVVRENLEKLQECRATENINRIMAKYLDISKPQEPLSKRGETSGSGCVKAKERKPSIRPVEEKFSSASKDNSALACTTPNVVNERKRKLSILVNKNNSKCKSDNLLRTPKRVRFTLDNNKSLS